MATIGNAYYQSPWIEKAAANLAEALRPPDRNKLLEQKKLEYEIERAQQVAAQEDEIYNNTVSANEDLGKVFELTANPVKNPLTNEIDRVETERQVLQHLGGMATKGGIKYVDPGLKSAGPAAPTFAVSEALANQRGQIRGDQIAQQIQGTLSGILLGQQGQDRRQAAGFQNDAVNDARDFDYRMRLLTAEQEGDLKAIQARAKAAGGNPLTIAGTALNDLTRLMYQQVQQSGAEMDKRDFSEMVARAAILMSQGRNAPTAVIEAYRKHVNEDDVTVEDGGWFGTSHRYLKPHFDDGVLPTQNSGVGYGTVLVPGQIPGVTPGIQTPAPAASAPPADRLKEGVPRKFPANGQVWELRNGVPVRRPDLED